MYTEDLAAAEQAAELEAGPARNNAYALPPRPLHPSNSLPARHFPAQPSWPGPVPAPAPAPSSPPALGGTLRRAKAPAFPPQAAGEPPGFGCSLAPLLAPRTRQPAPQSPALQPPLSHPPLPPLQTASWLPQLLPRRPQQLSALALVPPTLPSAPPPPQPLAQPHFSDNHSGSTSARRTSSGEFFGAVSTTPRAGAGNHSRPYRSYSSGSYGITDSATNTVRNAAPCSHSHSHAGGHVHDCVPGEAAGGSASAASDGRAADAGRQRRRTADEYLYIVHRRSAKELPDLIQLHSPELQEAQQQLPASGRALPAAAAAAALPHSRGSWPPAGGLSAHGGGHAGGGAGLAGGGYGGGGGGPLAQGAAQWAPHLDSPQQQQQPPWWQQLQAQQRPWTPLLEADQPDDRQPVPSDWAAQQAMARDAPQQQEQEQQQHSPQQQEQQPAAPPSEDGSSARAVLWTSAFEWPADSDLSDFHPALLQVRRRETNTLNTLTDKECHVPSNVA